MAVLARVGRTEAAVADLAERARAYAEESRSAATLRAYASDLADFRLWCEQHRLTALPAEPQSVALYLTERAETHTVGTLRRRMAAISVEHRLAGLEPPTSHAAVKSVFAGIRRSKGTAQRQKEAIRTDDLRRMVATLSDNTIGRRDRALLLLGFAGAFRRSEIVALDVQDVQFVREGALVTIRKSKTDQEQSRRIIAIPYASRPDTCPVRSLKAWIESAVPDNGALFRAVNRHGQLQQGRMSAQSVSLIVKRRAAAAGLNPCEYAGHSLRSGFCTSAAEGGAGEREIMEQSGHKSVVIARKYIRKGTLWQNHAGYRVGL